MKIKTSVVTKFLTKNADVRSYSDAHALVRWLNEAPEEENRRIAIRLIQAVRRLNADATQDYATIGLQLDQINALIEPLQKLRWTCARKHSPSAAWYIDQTRPGDSEFGLLLIARLSSHGLDWIRQCAGPECDNWFLGTKKNHRFCSDKKKECRQKFWDAKRKTPEGRSDRADYMQRRRETIKKLRKPKKERRNI